jgi:hypothetical protein
MQEPDDSILHISNFKLSKSVQFFKYFIQHIRQKCLPTVTSIIHKHMCF